MSGVPLATIVVVVLLGAVTCSTCWVLRDARSRGLPWRKATTWAALQWIEFPLFLWLYRRIRPRSRRRSEPGASTSSDGG